MINIEEESRTSLFTEPSIIAYADGADSGVEYEYRYYLHSGLCTKSSYYMKNSIGTPEIVNGENVRNMIEDFLEKQGTTLEEVTAQMDEEIRKKREKMISASIKNLSLKLTIKDSQED